MAAVQTTFQAALHEKDDEIANLKRSLLNLTRKVTSVPSLCCGCQSQCSCDVRVVWARGSWSTPTNSIGPWTPLHGTSGRWPVAPTKMRRGPRPPSAPPPREPGQPAMLTATAGSRLIPKRPRRRVSWPRPPLTCTTHHLFPLFLLRVYFVPVHPLWVSVSYLFNCYNNYFFSVRMMISSNPGPQWLAPPRHAP